MSHLQRLIEGYRRFREADWSRERERWAEMAEGQSPKVMILSCADSRDPGPITVRRPDAAHANSQDQSRETLVRDQNVASSAQHEHGQTAAVREGESIHNMAFLGDLGQVPRRSPNPERRKRGQRNILLDPRHNGMTIDD